MASSTNEAACSGLGARELENCNACERGRHVKKRRRASSDTESMMMNVSGSTRPQVRGLLE